MLKVCDLFAGTGCVSKAFLDCGNTEIVYANDFCKNSKKIYDINFSHKLDNCNIFDAKINKNIDILCGGFPCQPFSISGLKKGFDDERSNVFWKMLDIIKQKNPRFLLLENVKNLKGHDKGETFKVISNSLKNEGYSIKDYIINTYKQSGVPQNRERIYIIGFKEKEDYNSFNLELKNKTPKPIKNYLENNIDEKYYYDDRFKVYDIINTYNFKNISENCVYQLRRKYIRENKNNVVPTLTANAGSGGHNVPLIKDEKGIRKLTPKECFNFQGFPEDYIVPENMSDASLYKLAGNSISYPVVKEIANKIVNIYK